MLHITRESGNWANTMDSANLHGQMDKYMLETMSMDLDMEKASTALSFKEGTKVSGK